jgi:hypothetical protein
MNNLLQKLQKEAAEKNKKASNLVAFEDIPVVYLGTDNKPYYPKLKDNNGNTLKDEKGKERRSPTSTGFLSTFSELGTSKIVKVVLAQSNEFTLLSPYRISGLGFDLTNASMIFIQENGMVKKYE